jgi:hypothetical protein
MAKDARERRRKAQRARREVGPAAGVADRADRGVATLLNAVKNFAALKGSRLKVVDLEGFGSLRDSFIGQGYRWPAWCFLPAPMVGAGLGEDVAIDINTALLSPATMLTALGAAWVAGRIAVRFDDNVARALMDTPIEGTIPTQVLYRLPAWGLYVDCPGLGEGAGFFVSLDAGTVSAPGSGSQTEVDELLFAVVRSGDNGPPLLATSLWLRPGATIADALAEQARQAERVGPVFLESADEAWIAALGMSRAEVMARLLSLVLYLCSDDTDVTRRQVPPGEGSARGRPAAPTEVMSAGFRLGAALRTAAAEYARTGGEGTGQHVVPHMRRAHWHHFWAGSEARQDRHLRLLWVFPIKVNAQLSDELLTVVRPAGNSGAGDDLATDG